MTTDDKIRDQKLQFDINREAAIISALSSGKIDKYKYLTGEEILPFNQRQIIEQPKFTYSPLGKAFERQTKTIEGQEKTPNRCYYKSKRKTSGFNQLNDHKDNYKEVFEELVTERFDEIKELTDEIDHDDLIYYFTGNTAIKIFDHFNNGMELFRKIQSGEVNLEEVKNCRMYLNQI